MSTSFYRQIFRGVFLFSLFVCSRRDVLVRTHRTQNWTEETIRAHQTHRRMNDNKIQKPYHNNTPNTNDILWRWWRRQQFLCKQMSNNNSINSFWMIYYTIWLEHVHYIHFNWYVSVHLISCLKINELILLSHQCR